MKLTALTLEQCEIVREWRNQVLETLRTPYPLTEEMQETFYREVVCNRNSSHRYWAVMEDAKEETGLRMLPVGYVPPTCLLIGMGGITHVTWENRIGEISLIIDPTLREKGYGEKAVDLLLDEGFNKMGLNTVIGEVYACNDVGATFWPKVADKYGAYTTSLPNRKFWNGEFWDSLYFSIDADGFRKAKTNATE